MRLGWKLNIGEIVHTVASFRISRTAVALCLDGEKTRPRLRLIRIQCFESLVLNIMELELLLTMHRAPQRGARYDPKHSDSVKPEIKT